MKTKSKEKSTSRTGIKFNEDFEWEYAPVTRPILIDAKSYSKWFEDTFNYYKIHKQRIHDTIKFEDGKLHVRKLPAHYPLAVYHGRVDSYIAFDGDIDLLTLSDSYGRTWMSITPNEIYTLRKQISHAKGHTAIAGLGLGYTVIKALANDDVKHVTVIEKNQEVARVIGGMLKEVYGDKLTIIVDDAYTHKHWKKYDVSLWDIWMGYQECLDDSKYLKIKMKILKECKVCIGWGER